MKIAIYDEQDDEDPYSYGNGGLLVYHNAGTWKMYTDDVTRVQIADYLGIANKDIDFSEQGMQSEEYMHFDIEDDAVAQLIEKGAFKLEESTTEDDMSTGTVSYGKKGKTRRATGIDDNPYDHNEGEDHPALVNAALWNIKDIYQTIMAGEEVSEDDMFSYGDVLQYLDMSGIPGYEFYEDFIDTVSTAVSQAQPGGFAGQGDAVLVDKKFAPKIKTLYQQLKAATAKIKGVKENERELPSPTYKIPASMSIPMALHHLDQMEVTKQLRQAAGFPESAYVYFDDADLVYGDKTVWPQCGVDRKCKFGDAVEALKKFATAGVKEDEGSDKEKWLRYSKFWKYIRDIMAQEADADIADGFISADNIDEEPSYVTAKEMMQTAMAKQNTPWNDAIINSDLEEYRHQISDNDNYTKDTNFGKMKKAAIEMITTGKTQIVPYRGYPPMDQMDYSAEDTTDEDINDIVRLSGIK